MVAEEAGAHGGPGGPGPAPGYPLDPEPGGAGDAAPPALRELYSFQARAVDLAGNSISLEQADHDYVTPAEVYRRHEVVPRR